MSFFTKLRHYPEFHAMIGVLADLDKAEESLLQNQNRAFGPEFRKYAGGQKGTIPTALKSTAEAGTQQAKINSEVFTALRTLSRDLQPLLAQETEWSKFKENVGAVVGQSERSNQAAERADAALAKAKATVRPTDIAKAEAAANSAHVKQRDDETAAERQKSALAEKEPVYRQKFLESLVAPLTAAINIRFKAAEKLIALADEFESAAEGFQDFEDPAIKAHEAALQDLEAVVVE
jgi:hypothetical protein